MSGDTAQSVKVALDDLRVSLNALANDLWWDHPVKWLPKDYLLGSEYLTTYLKGVEHSVVAIRQAYEAAATRYRLECLQWLTAEAENK